MEKKPEDGNHSESGGQAQMMKSCNSDEKKQGEERKEAKEEEPPLMALNHVSRLCRDVQKSVDFYTKVVGMVLTERPEAFDFDGAWLFNFGIGIHLVRATDEDKSPDPNHELDPMDSHISFQCEDIEAMGKRLKEYNVKYMKRTVEDENRTKIDQLFFNDPDGFMIEICNCENLKLVPGGPTAKIRLPRDRHNPPLDLQTNAKNHSKPENTCGQ